MAENYSVKAVLSADDKNFSSTFKKAMGTTDSLKSKITSGLGFGVLMGAGQKAFSVISGGITGMIGELNDSGKAWKTFTGNMEMSGKTADEIKGIKKELQSFAEQSIYSSSDMASTFAQLEAVGTKNTTKLVKGFGGLAAAAESPKQAMKTLSQQATQMAAKPTVAWMDFKLMLEQTPAGIAAVAKEMGMTTTELVTNVQDGKIATEDFFNAITAVGNNDAFSKLATQYKSVGEATDGLQETVSNKLAPAFQYFEGVAISSVEKVMGKLDGLDGEVILGKITGFIGKAKPYWDVFVENVTEVRTAFGETVGAVVSELGKLTGAFGTSENIKSFGDMIGTAKDALVTFAGFLEDHADKIAKVISVLPQLFVAFKGFQILKTIAPFALSFGAAIGSLAKAGLGKIAPGLFKVSSGQEAVGKSSAGSSKKLLASAKAMLMVGAAVVLISGGFYILAQSAVALANAGPLAVGVMAGLVVAVAGLSIGMMAMMKTIKASPAKLTAMATAFLALGAAVLMISGGFALLAMSAINIANAGPLAIGVMVGLVAAIALLAVGASILGPALTAGAVGFIAFGAAIALVGVGALLAATALTLVAGVLPTVVEYGASGAVAIAQLGLGMIAFAGGAALAGAACVFLGVGLAAVAVGLTLVGVGVIVVAAGMALLAAGTLVLGVGLTLVAASATVLAGVLPALAAGAMVSAAGLLMMMGAAVALGAGLIVLSASMVALVAASAVGAAGIAIFGAAMLLATAGVAAMVIAIKAVNSNMKSISKSASSANASITSMKGSLDIVNSGLDALGSKVKSAMNTFVNTIKNTNGKAKSAATSLANGFNSSLQSGLSKSKSVASSAASSIISALNSASSGAYSSGYYIGVGLANGMSATLGMVRSVASQLAAAAEEAVIAKAKIGSPSRVFKALGVWIGKGFSNGMEDMQGLVKRTSEKLVNIPNMISGPEPTLALATDGGSMSLDDKYSYTNSGTYTIVVPVEVDGKEVARVTAPYTQEELNKRERRANRNSGIR